MDWKALGVGLALGIVFGVALHEIAIGLLIGTVWGVVLGMAWAAKAKRQPPES
jgi:hypothetical protein